MELSYASTNLKSISQNCLLEQEARLEERKLKFNCLSGDFLGPCFIDEVRIGQVITNFLSNAIKFTPENSQIEFEIKETTMEVDNQKNIPALLYSVRDYGNGIPEGEHEIVFDKFIQSSDKTITAVKGTGLGLPICKEIIELHHGKIWAENHPSVGAIFNFIIPVAAIEIKEESH